MGIKTCSDCTGNGWDFSPSDAKIKCHTCNGSGVVDSDEPGDEYNEAVIVNGRKEVRRIDITK